MENTENLWPGWETVRVIGKGGFGTVYEIQREVFGKIEKSALKVITIPENLEEIDELYSDGYDVESITIHYKSCLEDIVREYSYMLDMKGNTNIVYCDDLRYIQHDNGIGWDIYIKMELLTPLTKVLSREYNEYQTIKLGIDICNALILCKKASIVHRDIKPQNIFVSNNGDYKLGDFGIAKVSDKTTYGTQIGTFEYMAPEIYHGEAYGVGTDIYSLGMVLYWMMNDKRTPFLPLPPEIPTASMKENARFKRFKGEELPEPAHGSSELKRIVIKACAYNAKDRYLSAIDMMKDLKTLVLDMSSIGNDFEVINIECDLKEDKTVCLWNESKQGKIQEDKTERLITEDVTEHLCQKDKTEHLMSYEDKLEIVNKEGKKKVVPILLNKRVFVMSGIGIVSCLIVIGIILFGIFFTRQKTDSEQTIQTQNNIQEKQEVISTTKNETKKTENIMDMDTKDEELTVVDFSSGIEFNSFLMSDGTVQIEEWNDCYFDCSKWKNIKAISANNYFLLGLKEDGTVVYTGILVGGVDRHMVDSWNDITAVAAGGFHSLGLKGDGTVVAVGDNDYGQCDVSDWRNIVSISASSTHSVGLKADGTVVAIGSNHMGQCNVSEWKNIIKAIAGEGITVGLKEDGTVLCTCTNWWYDSPDWVDIRNVSEWTDIIDISATGGDIVGLKKDGTVVAAGFVKTGKDSVYEWTDIIEIRTGMYHIIGQKADGTFVMVENIEGR